MKTRKSNYELMRISSMLMIIMWHLIIQGGILDNSSPATKIILEYITTLLVVHVNSFVLLTGYFQSEKKFKFSKFLKLIGEVWFYKVVFLTLVIVFNLKDLTTLQILQHLSPINYGDYWFLQMYVLLYLISPILNKLINSLDKEHYQKSLLVIFIIVSLLPTLTNQVAFNNHCGYSLTNFIFLYLIGAYIKKYPINTIKISTTMKQTILLFLFFLLGFFSLTTHYFSLYIAPINKIFEYFASIIGNMHFYDSPLVIVQSVIYFLLFKNLHINDNKLINIISKTTIGVYLIHANHLFLEFTYKFFGYTSYMNTSFKLLLFLFVHTILLFIICSLIELIRSIITRFLFKRKIIQNICMRLKQFIDSFNLNISW